MTMKLSVIIPVFNEEAYIDGCLGSICSQTYPPHEVIVIDDGSNDATVEYIHKYPVTLLLQSHQGPANARNYGANQSSGEILVFLDADMTFEQDFLEKLVQPILKGKAIGTFTKEEYVANTENRWANFWTLNDGLPQGHRLFSNTPDETPVFRAIIRQEFFQVGGYDNLGYGEDSSIANKLGKRATAAPGAVCYHNNPGSLKEVFQSAQWIGKGHQNAELMVFRKFFLLNSIRSGTRISRQTGDYYFLVFKLIYDLGISWGMLKRGVLRNNHAK